MAKAYLQLNTEIGKEKEVKEQLLKIKGVKSADLVTGINDIIVILEGRDYEEILNTVLTKVRSIKGLSKTTTNLVAE